MIGNKTTIFSVALAAVFSVILGGCAADSTGDPVELDRTWRAADVYLPSDGTEIPNAVKIQGLGSSVLRLKMGWALDRGAYGGLPAEKKFPLVVYMHGCTGVSAHNGEVGAFLADKLGVLVIQPDSFARKYRPRNCDPKAKRGGMFRGALAFRVAEANYAIRKARELSWIDGGNIFLMGHSEGGITVSRFTGEAVNARIITGATCHYGWSDWSGLKAPDTEPVLAVLGARDPWQRGKPWQGRSCGSLMSKTNGSKNIIVTEGPFSRKHAVAMDPDVRNAILEFIQAHMR